MTQETIPTVLMTLDAAPLITPEKLNLAIETEKELRAIIINYCKKEMREGYHYGKVPGAKKDSLWKAGALNLCSLFKVTPVPQDPQDTFTGEHLNVRFKVLLVNAAGEVAATGFGMCSSAEGKYSHTKPVNVYNTVMKMAEIRALKDAVLKLPLVSEIFCQDIDEDREIKNITPQASQPRPASEAEIREVNRDNQSPPSLLSPAQKAEIKKLYDECVHLRMYEADFSDAKKDLQDTYGVDSVVKLTAENASTLIGMLKGIIARAKSPASKTLHKKIIETYNAAVDKKFFATKPIAWEDFKARSGKKALSELSTSEAKKLLKEINLLAAFSQI